MKEKRVMRYWMLGDAEVGSRGLKTKILQICSNTKVPSGSINIFNIQKDMYVI